MGRPSVKPQLIKQLVDLGHKESELNNMKIPQLEELLNGHEDTSTDDSVEDEDTNNLFDVLVAEVDEEDDEIVPLEDNEDIPDYLSPKWHEYVMSQFSDDELDEKNGKKYPNINGLRRVAEKLLGPIINSGPISTTPAKGTTDGSGDNATCIFQVHFMWQVDEDFPERIFTATAGAGPHNIDPEYVIYPDAIAETRAESRALRRALKLNVASSEEIANKPASPMIFGHELISTTQKKMIEVMCSKLRLDKEKFVNQFGHTWNELDKVPKHEASEMCVRLNKYQSTDKNSMDIPDEIKVS